MHLVRSRRVGIALVAATVVLLVVAGVADAHIVKTFGKYTVALGWVHEPTYVGEQNAVQVVIKDASGKAVTDLNDGDLKVTVTAGGVSSTPLPLLNTFDPDTGLGVPGDYEAPLIPTAPGDYTFHLSGTIDGTAVDETATSSDSTFNSVVDATPIQFPNQLPALTDIVTRLDRIDARLAASPAPSAAAAAPGSSAEPINDAVDAASSAAANAQNAANNALLLGGIVGAAGVIIGLAALAMAMRNRRA
ncbi:MAG: hypothetical protein ACRDGI_09270 [Candidatus Limnocylindrales bacterium]